MFPPVRPLLRIAFALSALLASSCTGSESEGAPRNAVLITLDSTRADALGRYGRIPSVTPALDALAGEALTFTNAHTVAPLTLPAHASMLTGLVPLRHSIRDDARSALPDNAVSIAELAADRGFQTAAFVSASTLDPRFELDQGFAAYDGPARPSDGDLGRIAERPAAETVRAAIRWLGEHDRERPFLLWVHLFDPHAPYAPPEKFLQVAAGDAYLGEVASTDEAVGELLAVLRESGDLASTLVVVAGDHGEARGEHGEPSHGTFCYESTLRVPLLIRYPDRHRGGEGCESAVSVADVAPTLIEALDLGSCYGLDGVSLFRRDVPEGRGVYFESYAGFLDHGWSPLAGRIEGSIKYIASSAPELYDLSVDPAETRNLLPAREADRPRFEEAIVALAARPALEHDPWNPVDPELLRGLEDLGYRPESAASAVLPPPIHRLDLPAPAERTAELQACFEARALIEAGAFEEAAALMEPVVAANARNVVALDALARARMRLERFDQARESLEQRLRIDALAPDLHFHLAECLERLGELDAARTHARIAKRLGCAAAGLPPLIERLGSGPR